MALRKTVTDMSVKGVNPRISKCSRLPSKDMMNAGKSRSPS
jgi:hypothetical protein